jgi:hypothetical protein
LGFSIKPARLEDRGLRGPVALANLREPPTSHEPMD